MADGRGNPRLMDLSFDAETMRSAVDRCLAWCAERPARSHTVITANAAILCMMRRDRELSHACRAGDMTVADGMSVVWALRASGQPVPERIAGVDLMARLLEEGAGRALRVYFLGAREEVVTALADACARRHPGIVVAGFRNGYFSPLENDAIVDAIRHAAPDVLFVGMPSPFKEVFCERYRERLRVPVLMGVGGSFDVLAGRVRRAPRWMRAIGMEWSWRLLMEPRKMWKRYLTTNAEFLWIAGREARARRFGGAAQRERRPPAAGAPSP